MKSYYANHEKTLERMKKARDRRRAAQGIIVEPDVASWMAGMRAAPRRLLLQSWTQNLFERMDAIIAENGGSRHTMKGWRRHVRIILTHAENDELAQERDITPAWLAGSRLQTKVPRTELIYRANFGRMLLRLGLWSEGEYKLFCDNQARELSGSPGTRAHGPKPTPSPRNELRRLVRELAYRCGLSTGEMRDLRITDIQADGLRISPKPKSSRPGGLVPKLGRLISFGDGWDELPKTTLDVYIRKEKPTDYLFFSRSPRDKKRPLSRMTLAGETIKSLRNQHFEKDLSRARSLQAARFHLRNVHHLDNKYTYSVVTRSRWRKGYAHEVETIPIPASYLLAAMCASRSVPEENAKTTIPESGGGKRHLMTWHDLLGYEITVDWPRRFAAELGGRGQKSVRALRLLYRLAFDFWFEGRRTKLSDLDDSAIRPEDKDLLEPLAATRVTVRNLASSQASWAGSLFEYGSRKRSFRIPLIEDMNRRAWHTSCQICWHPERRSIEREISEAGTKDTRVKGYHLIADKYRVSYQSLLAHSGRKKPRPGRGETQRSHFSLGPISPIVRCPRKLFWQLPTLGGTELAIYSLVLLETNRAGTPGLVVSTQLIEQGLGLRLSESQLSVALNHLTGAGMTSFRRDPKGFYMELCTLTKFTHSAQLRSA